MYTLLKNFYFFVIMIFAKKYKGQLYMHLPRINYPKMGGTKVGALKRICTQSKTAIKRTLPAVLMSAQTLTLSTGSRVPVKVLEYTPKITTELAADTIQIQPKTANFFSIKGMVSKVVPDVKDEFVNEILETAEKVNCDAEDLTALLYKESRFKPDVKNGNFGGIGQMNDTSIKLSVEEALKHAPSREKISEMAFEKFLTLPRAKQMPYVRNYILAMKNFYMKKHKEKLTGGELYALFYTPSRVKKDFLTSAKDSATKKYYKSNAALDFDKDSVITTKDLQMVLNDIKSTVLNTKLAKNNIKKAP